MNTFHINIQYQRRPQHYQHNKDSIEITYNMKRFIVVEATKEKYEQELFEIETRIKHSVTVPFSTREWRCIMFDGIRIHLTNGEEKIIGSLM